ncbi:MAG: XTP/dITP diphosphatase [Clostridia bacterium]|nr:MAG: XTP/dITP diphosphatase [Clostridia bacterium]
MVLATKNEGKRREFVELLGRLPLEVVSLAGWPEVEMAPETGTTFAENALLKARRAATGTGLPAVADDSGLEVDYLNGEPGIYSARFAGDDRDDQRNNAKLLELLATVPRENRTCRFRCALAVVTPAGKEWVVEGTCEGLVAFAPRGSGGFGYDPLFYLPEYDCTMAELPPEVKNKISHRAKAVARAMPILQEVMSV